MLRGLAVAALRNLANRLVAASLRPKGPFPVADMQREEVFAVAQVRSWAVQVLPLSLVFVGLFSGLFCLRAGVGGYYALA